MISALIIDDEPNAIGLLTLRLAQHCPQVELVAACTSSHKGVQAILDYRPELVFLDIEMPRMNGFEVLEAVAGVTFSLVFVTAYDKFALKAFRCSAVDYLLKPIDTQELIQAVQRAEKSQKTSPEQLEHLKGQLSHQPRILPDRLALPYQNGVAFVNLKDIVYCESDDNYTRFYLTDGQQYLATKSLRDIQDLLEEGDFLRVHRQYLINLSHIKKYVKGEGNYVIMTSQKSIPVSRAHKDRLMERFGWL